MKLRSKRSAIQPSLNPRFRGRTVRRATGRLGAIGPDPQSDLKRIAELAVKNRLPVMYGRPEHVEAGGLMSYGVNLA